MAFVVRLLPLPPAPAPDPGTPARWRLALAATRAVGLVSAGFVFASLAGMAVGFLSCGDGEETSVSCATQGEICPVFCAAFRVFRVSFLSMAGAGRVLDLLRICQARSKAKEQKAAARVKSLDYAIIIEHIIPAACFVLVFVGILLESRAAKGSLMETVGSLIFYVAMGMMALIVAVLAIVAVMVMAVALCAVVALCAMAVWECYNTVEVSP
ncbi:unnamed protein product [Urochloa humidicola]